MAGAADADTTAAVNPAQIAGLAVSVFAIVVFTSLSIYLCGQRRDCPDCQKATQHMLRRLSHIHHHHHHYHQQRSHHNHSRTRIIAQDSAASSSGQGTIGRGRFFAKLKAAFGIKTSAASGPAAKGTKSSSLSAAKAEVSDQQPMMQATSPLQRCAHPGTSNPYSGAEEFQAAVHNLLGYQPGEVQEWYCESDDEHNMHGEIQPERREAGFSEVVDHSTTDLPTYEQVPADPRRFSWQGDESDYRPEKREE